ncbi:MAG TPA: efflux RND transporter periplasmic adaptor subunit [Candidatus Angelobacter sp.]|nr:efflux RND transporter periplasmic adaptor subunit [Candidatus Angelobacter sp.]
MTPLTEQQTREVEQPVTQPGAASRSSNATRAAAVALLVLLLAGGFSVARRFSEKKSLAKETEKLAVPVVSVIKPGTEPAQDELVLPAQLQAYVESPIYARTNGYLMHWYKDIGAHVKKGEILADIDAPEVDQELRQAKAARDQIQAQMDLAKISADRWTNLRRTDSVSQQEADQQTSAYTQSRANLAAADANVRRLEELEAFKRVYAPFSGVITRRNIDIGALINAGSAGQTKELFDLAQFDPLRVYVSVPQADATSIKAGMPAYIELREYPGQKFTGKVARSADAIDMSTRTMLTEVDVPNRDGRLLPGAYAQVHFAVPVATVRISVPVNALLFRPEGARVATVGSDQKIHLAAVIIGRDFGNKIEILGGLKPTDDIVVNPADSLEEGESVQTKPGAGGGA